MRQGLFFWIILVLHLSVVLGDVEHWAQENEHWAESFPSSVGYLCDDPHVKMLENPIDLREPEKCSAPKNVIGVNKTVQILARNNSHTMQARQCFVQIREGVLIDQNN